MLARDFCVKKPQRHLKTGLGLSVVTYQKEKEEPLVGGEIQGKADVPALYTLNSSLSLDLHKAISPGLCLQSCTIARAIKYNNVVYSNDIDVHVSAEHNSEFLIERVVEDMRESAEN